MGLLEWLAPQKDTVVCPLQRIRWKRGLEQVLSTEPQLAELWTWLRLLHCRRHVGLEAYESWPQVPAPYFF